MQHRFLKVNSAADSMSTNPFLSTIRLGNKMRMKPSLSPFSFIYIWDQYPWSSTFCGLINSSTGITLPKCGVHICSHCWVITIWNKHFMQYVLGLPTFVDNLENMTGQFHTVCKFCCCLIWRLILPNMGSLRFGFKMITVILWKSMHA